MKKFIFSCLFLFMSLFCYSQSIICDEIKYDVRHIKTEKIVTKDKANSSIWTFELNGYSKDNDSISYELVISINKKEYITYPYNSIILIKTFDDKIISLDNNYIYSGSIVLGDKYDKFIVEHIKVFYEDNHITSVSYIITPEEIKLFKNGIKKIRIQTLSGYEEIVYENDKCGKVLYQSLKNINDKFKTDNSIYSNF